MYFVQSWLHVGALPPPPPLDEPDATPLEDPEVVPLDDPAPPEEPPPLDPLALPPSSLELPAGGVTVAFPP
jgi:hypothetical protein